jgi:hypothetical protein
MKLNGDDGRIMAVFSGSSIHPRASTYDGWTNRRFVPQCVKQTTRMRKGEE